MTNFCLEIDDNCMFLSLLFLSVLNRYDHPHIIAGQGTLGLEIVEQVPDIDAVVVPVGGAGLIAGVAIAVKTLRPNCMIIVSMVLFSFFLIIGLPY